MATAAAAAAAAVIASRAGNTLSAREALLANRTLARSAPSISVVLRPNFKGPSGHHARIANSNLPNISLTACVLCLHYKATLRVSTQRHTKEFMNFSQLGLAPAQVRSCESLGYTEPTPIQKQAIPVVLRGEDLIGCAETGTGKTAAFLLPIIQRITESSRPGVRVLVLAPTRELALQIEKMYGELNPVKRNRCVTIMGGASASRQVDGLRKHPSVVIATPGRLLDLMERRSVDLSFVEVLVLDEADRMLDMGFLPAIRRVLAALPAKRQTLLFSATMSPEIERLARTTYASAKAGRSKSARTGCDHGRANCLRSGRGVKDRAAA